MRPAGPSRPGRASTTCHHTHRTPRPANWPTLTHVQLAYIDLPATGPHRSRWSLAHELAHLTLNPGTPGDSASWWPVQPSPWLEFGRSAPAHEIYRIGAAVAAMIDGHAEELSTRIHADLAGRSYFFGAPWTGRDRGWIAERQAEPAWRRLLYGDQELPFYRHATSVEHEAFSFKGRRSSWFEAPIPASPTPPPTLEDNAGPQRWIAFKIWNELTQLIDKAERRSASLARIRRRSSAFRTPPIDTDPRANLRTRLHRMLMRASKVVIRHLTQHASRIHAEIQEAPGDRHSADHRRIRAPGSPAVLIDNRLWIDRELVYA